VIEGFFITLCYIKDEWIYLADEEKNRTSLTRVTKTNIPMTDGCVCLICPAMRFCLQLPQNKTPRKKTGKWSCEVFIPERPTRACCHGLSFIGLCLVAPEPKRRKFNVPAFSFDLFFSHRQPFKLPLDCHGGCKKMLAPWFRRSAEIKRYNGVRGVAPRPRIVHAPTFDEELK